MTVEIEIETGTEDAGYITNKEYHAQKSLSASSIKDILENPYKFFAGIKRPQTQAMALGSAVHCMVLEPHRFNEEFVIMPEINTRTVEGRNTKAMFEMDNQEKIIISQPDLLLAREIARTVFDNVRTFFDGGVAEKSIKGVIDGVDIRARPDYYIERYGLVVDLKVVADASQDGFSKMSANFGYYIQQAVYTELLRQNGMEVNKFLFVAVEKEAPHMIGLYTLDDVAVDFGMKEVRRAIEIYKRPELFSSPVFKDTVDGSAVQTITLPNWVYYKNGASL